MCTGVNYSLIPMGRLGRPEEIADAVRYLLSDKALFATSTHLIVAPTQFIWSMHYDVSDSVSL